MKKLTPFIAILCVVAAVAFFWLDGFNGIKAASGKGNQEPQVTQTSNTSAGASKMIVNGNLRIHVLDIGQGDAILIQVGNRFSLIDTGDVETRDRIVGLLHQYGVKQLDKVIITHPHADHLGGFYAIAKHFPIAHVYENGYPLDSNVYTTYERIVQKKGIDKTVLRVGDIVDFGDGVTFKVFAPWKDPMKQHNGHLHVNNNSIVGKLVYKEFSMLFTGDCEKDEEARLIKEQGNNLKSTLLKVGHHGSNGASSTEFLNAVHSKAAFISCGLGNSYGHPGEKTIQRLTKANNEIYRTDTMGTITIQTDGQSYSVQHER